MKLHHLTNKEIDIERWDAALANSDRPLIYANSWYLNIVSPNWEGFVNEDYTTIVPLPVSYKFGIKIVTQPPFCQQLGSFTNRHHLCEERFTPLSTPPFATRIYQTKNILFKNNRYFSKERVNLILPLQKEYTLLKKGFNQNTRRNIKEAKKHNQKIEQTFSAARFIQFSQEHAPYSLSSKSWTILKKIVETSLENKTGTLWTITNNQDIPLCMSFFLHQYNRITFLSGHSSPQGFKQKSMFLLMNEIIQTHAESKNTLDFEGGSLKGVARFYKGFGAKEEVYYIWQNPIIKKIDALIDPIKRTIKI